MDCQNYLTTIAKTNTTFYKPLKCLEQLIVTQQDDIEQWFAQQWQTNTPPFYTSVDLRHAGYKLAPVDTNLFPAGFNNLPETAHTLSVQAAQIAVYRLNPLAKRVLLIPENHTRNLYYLENITVLLFVLQQAGYEVRVGSLLPDLSTAQTVQLPSGRTLILEPIQRHGKQVRVGEFIPQLILLNNDLSVGCPALLQDLHQPVAPPVKLGWSHRLKSQHFSHYQQVAQQFAEDFDLDVWLINPLFENCGKIDFMKREGGDCLSKHIGMLLKSIQRKYDEYGVAHKPFVIIKADAGSYGMGVMTVHSMEEARDLNRKQRTRMATTKEGQKIRRVIMQEGVYTFEKRNKAVAEPVIYMMDQFVIGGFYRINAARSVTENLNAPGMYFEPFDLPAGWSPQEKPIDDFNKRFYTYSVIARLASLAAAKEAGELLTYCKL